MCYLYTMEYYLAIKKNEIMSFAATWLDWWDYHTKWSISQTEKDKYDVTSMWNLKCNTNEHIYETEIDSEI